MDIRAGLGKIADRYQQTAEIMRNPLRTGGLLVGITLAQTVGGVIEGGLIDGSKKMIVNISSTTLEPTPDPMITVLVAEPTTSTVLTTTTVTVLEATTTTVPESMLHAAAVECQEPNRAEIAKLAAGIGGVMGMEELAALIPPEEHFQNIPEKLAHIERLRQEVDPLPADLAAHSRDRSGVGLFDAHPDANTCIQPQGAVIHWTADFYDSPEEMRDKMMGGEEQHSAHYLIDKVVDGKTRTVEFFGRDVQGAHARPLNQEYKGYEIMAGRLEDIGPEQTEELVVDLTEDVMAYGWEPNHVTIVSHMAVDLIFNNPTYNPPLRYVEYLRKRDIVQEYINMVIDEVKELHTEVLAEQGNM